MPEMVFEYILKKYNIDPRTDLTIIQNIDFGLTAQAFSSGQGDYTIEFEPAATSLEQEGKGKVVASLGVQSGLVPYTSFSAKKSYIEKNPEIIQKFTNALQKGMDYVATHNTDEIAKVIHTQFSETEFSKLVAILNRYNNQDSWKDNLVFEEESLTLLQDILVDAGVVTERAPYEDVVNTDFAKKAIDQK
jgi:NitT/TauT family transport system substrate-binding protein